MRTEIYSNGTTEVEVVFDDLHGELIDSVDHSVFYGIKGYGRDGNEYSATSEFCCGEFEGITDIELV
jgi:hypothetical protein